MNAKQAAAAVYALLPDTADLDSRPDHQEIVTFNGWTLRFTDESDRGDDIGGVSWWLDSLDELCLESGGWDSDAPAESIDHEIAWIASYMRILAGETLQVTGTDQTVSASRLTCGCEEWRYALPGHDSTVLDYPCDEHAV